MAKRKSPRRLANPHGYCLCGCCATEVVSPAGSVQWWHPISEAASAHFDIHGIAKAA
jgi:hypothetical protein